MKLRSFAAAILVLTLALAGCSKNTPPTLPVEPSNPDSGPTEPAPPDEGDGAADPPPQEEEPKGDAVRVRLPAANTEVAGPVIHVEGQARAWEATVLVEVEDGHNILARQVITATEGAPNWGDFAADIELTELPTNRHLTVIFYIESAEDGRRIELAKVPLKYTGPCANNRC